MSEASLALAVFKSLGVALAGSAAVGAVAAAVIAPVVVNQQTAAPEVNPATSQDIIVYGDR